MITVIIILIDNASNIDHYNHIFTFSKQSFNFATIILIDNASNIDSNNHIFTFSKQSFNFATVHSLKIYTNLIDSGQAHLSMQFASNMELIGQK